MNTILVSGLINLETTLQVETFPIQYEPVRYPFFGVRSTTAGVGFNIARALTNLGDNIRFISIVGKDSVGRLAIQDIQDSGVDTSGIFPLLRETAQSIILYDRNAHRQIHVDLKDIQQSVYPFDYANDLIRVSKLAILCNINFSRPLLGPARQAGCLIATDVHAICSLDDPYNFEFMLAADLLFMSHECLPCPGEEWARLCLDRFPCQVLVIGMGAEGALMAVRQDGSIQRYPAHTPPRPVVNTIGAGDALLSAFVHFYLQGNDPYRALARAQYFAAYKIGAAGAADGFLGEKAVIAEANGR